MKKIILLFLLITLCGCSKKLECNYKEDYEDIKIHNKIIFNYKNNTYEEIDKMIFNDEESAREYFEDIDEYKEEYNLKLEKNVITSNLIGDIKIDKDKKSTKEKYESYGYKCK